MVGVEGNEEIVDDNDDRAMNGNEGITATPTSDPLCSGFCWRELAGVVPREEHVQLPPPSALSPPPPPLHRGVLWPFGVTERSA